MVLFLAIIFSFSFFFMKEGGGLLCKSQNTYITCYDQMFLHAKNTHGTAKLSFNAKKVNSIKNNCQSGFSKKSSKSIFNDIIARNSDNTYHFKSLIQLHHFENKKEVVYSSLFLCFVLSRDIFIHLTDYYIYTLRKIIT